MSDTTSHRHPTRRTVDRNHAIERAWSLAEQAEEAATRHPELAREFGGPSAADLAAAASAWANLATAIATIQLK